MLQVQRKSREPVATFLTPQVYLREQKDNCQAGHCVLFSPLKHEKSFIEQVQIREIEREAINELRALERLVRPFCIILPIQNQA